MKKYLQVLTVMIAVLGNKSLAEDWTGVATNYSGLANHYLLHPQDSFYRKELMQYKDSNHLPGAIIAIKKPGQPLWIGAAGKSNIDDIEVYAFSDWQHHQSFYCSRSIKTSGTRKTKAGR